MPSTTHELPAPDLILINEYDGEFHRNFPFNGSDAGRAEKIQVLTPTRDC
jgi:hypothetical protein